MTVDTEAALIMALMLQPISSKATDNAAEATMNKAFKMLFAATTRERLSRSLRICIVTTSGTTNTPPKIAKPQNP